MAKKLDTFTELVRFDWFIKNMFRDKADFDILEGFLSELLHENITIIEILESEGNQNSRKDKFNRVDVMVKTAKDERIIVEIQNNDEYDYLQRILYGASKTIIENIKKGETYAQVKKIISVSIVYFSVGQGYDYLYHGTTTFRGIHKHDELMLTEEQKASFQKTTPAQIYPEYYLINALSFPDVIEDRLDEWVYFFKNSEVKSTFQAKGLDKAKAKLAIAKLPKNKRSEYDRYLTYLHDEASWNETQRLKREREEKLEKRLLEKEQALREKEQIIEKTDKELKKKAQIIEETDKELKKKAQIIEEAEYALKTATEAAAIAAEETKQAKEAEKQAIEQAQIAAEQARTEERAQVKHQAIVNALLKGVDEHTIAAFMDVPLAEVTAIKNTLTP